ncbi:MAG: Asp-tRNA(Asn)/Glu-tRNA(Gln) amidotransferase subunit GatC [Methermicoccaceae archaeon]
MALISREDLEHMGWLSRLALTDEEKDVFAHQLNTVLQYFNQLDEVDTEGVEPTYHVLRMDNVFRKDAVEPSLTQEEVLSNAPRVEKDHIRAPRIL